MDLRLVVLLVLSVVLVSGLDQPFKQAVASAIGVRSMPFKRLPYPLNKRDDDYSFRGDVGALGGCDRKAQWLFYQNMCYRTTDCPVLPKACASRDAAAKVCKLADDGYVRAFQSTIENARQNMKHLVNTARVQNALKAAGVKTVDEFIGNLKPLIFDSGCYHTKVTKAGVKMEKGDCKTIGGFVCKKAPGK